LHIHIVGLGDLGDFVECVRQGWEGEVDELCEAIKGVDDVHLCLKDCESINNIQGCFSQEFLDSVHIMYVPGNKDKRFDIRAKMISLELNNIHHDMDYIMDELRKQRGRVKVDICNILTAHLNLDFMDGIEIHELNISAWPFVQGEVRKLERINRLQVNVTSILPLISYIQSKDIFTKESKLSLLTFMVTSILSMDDMMSLVSLLPSHVEIGLYLSTYAFRHFAMIILRIFKTLKTMNRKCLIVYQDHDSYVIACALAKIFDNVSKQIHRVIEYEGCVDYKAASLPEIHSGITDEIIKDAWTFLSVM
jgi:hypothetical protein